MNRKLTLVNKKGQEVVDTCHTGQASNESFPMARVAFEGVGTEAAETFMPQQSWGGLLLLPGHRSDEGFQMAPGLDRHKFFGAGNAISFPARAVCLSAICLLVLPNTS